MLPPPIVTAYSGGRPQLGQAQNMSGWSWSWKDATNCSGTRGRACQCIACAAPGLQQPAALPSLLLRRSPQRSAAETCADLRNTSSPLDRPNAHARTALCDDIEAAIRCPRPRPPANDWLGTCVIGLQLPASPRPTSRPHSRREQRSGAHVAVAFAGHPTAVLRPAECTSHSAGRRAR